MLSRRNFLNKTLAASTWFMTTASGLFAPITAWATWSADKYARTDLETALLAIIGDQKPTKSNKISIEMPKVAENGAIVPITIHSKIAQTKSISIVAEKNPVPLIAQFSFAPEMDTKLTARIKLADTSDVIAIIRANDQFYIARKSVRVTVGGCGD